MHEFVLSGAPMKRELGIRTLDLAKRLLDHGFHPPTVYFPLLVDEALLVEPTETETKETLDGFAEAIAEILHEAREDPEIARQGAIHDAGAASGRSRRRETTGDQAAARARATQSSMSAREMLTFGGSGGRSSEPNHDASSNSARSSRSSVDRAVAVNADSSVCGYGHG